VAEVIEQYANYVLLRISTWVGKERVGVIVRAYSTEEPPRLRSNTFVAVKGVLARLNQAENGELVLSLENSTFSDKWSQALEPAQVRPSTVQH
jgi:hypothetical protein